MKIAFITTALLLSVSFCGMSQIYQADHGLTVSGSGESTKVSLGGTLNNSAAEIDFGSGNANSNFLLRKGTSNYLYVGNNGKIGILHRPNYL